MADVSVDVRIPAERADRPAWVGVAGVAAACLAIGVLLASLGVTPARTDEGEPPRSATESPRARDEAATDPEGDAPEAVAAPEPGAPEPEAEAGDESEAGAEPTPSEPEAETADAQEAPGATDEGALSPPSETASPGPLPTLSAAPARIERGRVAYLRCTGVERRGAFPCPRDEALEIRAWNALDAVASCPALADATGQADIVLDFRDSAPEVRSRDTFARDVRRLDPAATVACVAPALAGLRHATGAQRLVVSLRFALR